MTSHWPRTVLILTNHVISKHNRFHYRRSSVALVATSEWNLLSLRLLLSGLTQRSWGSDQVVPWDSPVPTPTQPTTHVQGHLPPLPKVGRGHRRREGEAGEHLGREGARRDLGVNQRHNQQDFLGRECHALSPKCRASNLPLGPWESTHTSAIIKSNISTYITVILFTSFSFRGHVYFFITFYVYIRILVVCIEIIKLGWNSWKQTRVSSYT